MLSYDTKLEPAQHTNAVTVSNARRSVPFRNYAYPSRVSDESILSTTNSDPKTISGL